MAWTIGLISIRQVALYHLLTAEIPFPRAARWKATATSDGCRSLANNSGLTARELATIVHCLSRSDRKIASSRGGRRQRWPGRGHNSAMPRSAAVGRGRGPFSGIFEAPPFGFGDESEFGRHPGTPCNRRAGCGSCPDRRGKVNSPLGSRDRGLFAVFLCVETAANIVLAGRKAEERRRRALEQANRAGRLTEDQADPPPAKDLEAAESICRTTHRSSPCSISQWQSAAVVRPLVVAPVSDQPAGFRKATGVDLVTAAERVAVGLAADDEAVVILQGRSLVTPRLVDGVKAMPGVRIELAWEGGPELAVLGDENPDKAVYAVASETSVVLSPHRRRVIEALEKRDGGRRTRLADPTIARGLEYASARPFAAFVTLGLRQEWAKSIPGATKLNFAAAGIVFDDRGMSFHTLADETEPGKAIELQRAFGRLLADKGKATEPADLRLERIASLLLDAEPVRLPPPRLRLTHTQHLVPARRLEEWFAPFIPKGDG